MTATPLTGLLVVDLGRYLPGPYASRLLRDLGARVIKVEEPEEGDPVRAAPPRRGGRGALAELLLPGIESIALDLKREGGREVLLALLERADVLLESFRPGKLESFGLPPAELRRRFPHLVICSISGYGQDGPQAPRAGHDLTYQALSGLLAPTARMPALPVADLVGAWSAAVAVLAALHQRDRAPSGVGRGEGCWIDAPLYDAALHANVMAWAAEADEERDLHVPGYTLPLTGAWHAYHLYRAADGGFVAFAALEPRHWERFCDAVGRRDWRKRQYESGPAMRRELEALFAARPRDEWSTLFTRLDFPGEPVLSASEVLTHPQALARAVVREGEDGLVRFDFPARFDGQRPPGPRSGVPALGEDTAAILAEWELPEAPASGRKRKRSGVGVRRSFWRSLWRLLAG
jgi:alpha-methylacyl-CoA racemase